MHPAGWNLHMGVWVIREHRGCSHLLSGVEPGKEPDLPRLLLPDQARHLGGPIPGVKAAHLGPGLPKHGIVCCYLHAAKGSQACPCAERWHAVVAQVLMQGTFLLV